MPAAPEPETTIPPGPGASDQTFSERLSAVADFLSKNWQVAFAVVVVGAAGWLWIYRAEDEVATGKLSAKEYLARAEETIYPPIYPKSLEQRVRQLKQALSILERMEWFHGIVDEPELWRAVEYKGDVRRSLAGFGLDDPSELGRVIRAEPRDLLLAAVGDYRRALAMKSPRVRDRRRLKVGLADALSELGRHAEVVEVLSPIVRELRRGDVDRLKREKDANAVSVGEETLAALSAFDMRVHTAMARSLRGLGRMDDAERHYGLVAANGSGPDRWLAKLMLGDIAVERALGGEKHDARALAEARKFYGEVYSGAPSNERRLKAGMRLGATLLAAGDAKGAAEIFAKAPGETIDVVGSRRAELMYGLSLLTMAREVPRGKERTAVLGRAVSALSSLIRRNPTDRFAAAAKVLLGDAHLLRRDLDGAWSAYAAMDRRWFDGQAGDESGMPPNLPGPKDYLSGPGMVERLLLLAGEYSAVRRHDAAIRVYERAITRWSAAEAAVRPKIAAECDLLAGKLAGRAAAAESDDVRRRIESEHRAVVMRAAGEYLAIATDEPTSPVHARALLIAADRFRSAGACLRAAKAYRRFAASFENLPAASRALHELGLCMQAVGHYRDSVLAFKENSERHFKEPYGYLSHFEWGNSLVKWGKLSGDGECPVEKPGMRARGLPAVVMGARQVFEEILEDGRYTPESLSWMKALVKLGQTYVMLADEEATGAIGSPERMKAAKELYRRGVSALTEALERYPLKKLELERDVKPAFYEFLKGEETATTEALAMAHLGLGEYRQALRYFQALRGMLEGVEPRGEKAESEGLSSRQKSLYFYTGLCYYRLGVAEVDPAKAGGHFRDALDIFSEARDKLLQEPESPWVRHGMALCYERLGDLEAAARSYRDAAWAYENVPEEALAPKELGRGFWLERNKTLREALEWKVRAGGDKGAM